VTGHITTQPKQSRLAVSINSVSIVNGIAAELFHPFVFLTSEGKNLKTKISMVKVFLCFREWLFYEINSLGFIIC
jgi:hypothetical protein